MPYKCDVCGRGFTSKISLQGHRSHHVREDKSLSIMKNDLLKAYQNMRSRKKKNRSIRLRDKHTPKRRRTSAGGRMERTRATTTSRSHNNNNNSTKRIEGGYQESHIVQLHPFHQLFSLLLRYAAFESSLLHKIEFKEFFNTLPTLDEWICKTTKNEKFQVREILWKNPEVLLEYVEENPDDLSKEMLLQVDDWRKYFKKGEFFLMEHTKRGSILLSNVSTLDGYYVKGLLTPLDVLFCESDLPVFVKTVLLPYKNEIISDGFFHLVDLTIQKEHVNNLQEALAKSKRRGIIRRTMKKEKGRESDEYVDVMKEEQTRKLDASHIMSPEYIESIIAKSKQFEDYAPTGYILSAAVILVKAAKLAKAVLDNPENPTRFADKVSSLKLATTRMT